MQDALDKCQIFDIIIVAVLLEKRICSGIEEVITSTTGNRVVVKSGTRVRIPPTAPEKAPETCVFRDFLFFPPRGYASQYLPMFEYPF